jgi:Ran GTPase-activating protein (RanGAP) involved in mRNA processing and transport
MLTSQLLSSHLNVSICDDDMSLMDDCSLLGDSIASLNSLNTTDSHKSPLKLSRYFGAAARNEFGRRLRWLSNQRRSLYKKDGEMLGKTRFESLYDPSEPHTSDNEGNNDDDADAASVDSFDAPSVKDDVEHGTMTSPRTRYITSCITKKLNPRMSLIVRKRVSPELNLQHQGMGDEMGLLFAESLKDIPYIHSLDISDNNLSDVSVGPILQAIISLPNITHLNLSKNNLDLTSSQALAAYLSTPNCPLRRLILQKSDIDDHECQLFVTALTGNTTLEELDMSSNLIGQAELMNTVHPELITGGEALADLLASNSCGLKVLRLGWNLIRLDGGIALAGCVSTNKYMTHLDLSYNALGKEGGEKLGSALLHNNTLQQLLLSNNNLNFTACFAICVAIEENFSLRKVNMDGNPIGEGGGQILMQIPFTAGNVFQSQNVK